VLKSAAMESLGSISRRENEGIVQYNASEILNVLFRKFRSAHPKSICVIAITNFDLFPESDFNFVFGLANVMTQVGVFSFYRY